MQKFVLQSIPHKSRMVCNRSLQVRLCFIMKKILSVVFVLMLCVGLIIPQLVFADNLTNQKIESIINGNQDFLVLASLGNKDSNYFDVQVVDVIGDFSEYTEEEQTALESRFSKSITVSGIESYVYFGENDDNPRTGDNVLISLSYISGDSYSVKNGVFRVDSAGREQFRFEVPERLNGSVEQNELTALYVYVYTNGHISDITVKNDGVSYKEDGKDKFSAMSDNVGIKFLDEFGDPANVENDAYPELQNGANGAGNKQQSKWKLVVVIVVLGLITGAFFVKLVQKFDKRFE